MKKTFALALMGLVAAISAPAARAHDYDRDDTDHPMRLLGYALHPIGYVAEQLIMRPIHCFVSMSSFTNRVFGHQSFGKNCKNAAHSATIKTEPMDASAVEPDGKGPASVGPELAPVGGEPATEMGIIYFDFDKQDIRADQLDKVEANLKYLKDHPELAVIVEGHCDERGTSEYNMSLGERRAKAVSDYFTKNGIDTARIRMLSKGEEEPADAGHSEEAWAKNRRVEFDKQVK